MAEEPVKIFAHVLEGVREEERLRTLDDKLAILAALRKPVEAADVEVARAEYELQLTRSRDCVRRGDSLEFIEEAQIATEVCKARFEYLSASFRAQQDELLANEARTLAKTNTQLAKSQTLIAGAVAFFTLVQVFLAIAQAMKWTK